jgi:hypothetical protein
MPKRLHFARWFSLNGRSWRKAVVQQRLNEKAPDDVGALSCWRVGEKSVFGDNVAGQSFPKSLPCLPCRDQRQDGLNNNDALDATTVTQNVATASSRFSIFVICRLDLQKRGERPFIVDHLPGQLCDRQDQRGAIRGVGVRPLDLGGPTRLDTLDAAMSPAATVIAVGADSKGAITNLSIAFVVPVIIASVSLGHPSEGTEPTIKS